MSTSHYTKTKRSYAAFSFTGAIQVHYMGLGNTREDVDTEIAIDFNGRTHRVDIYRDRGEHLQAILWSSDSLDSTATYTLVCRKISDDDGGMDLNIDAFILTIPDDIAPSPVRTPVSTRFIGAFQRQNVVTSVTSSTANPSAFPSSLSSNLSRTDEVVRLSSTPTRTITGVSPSVIWSPSLVINTQPGPEATQSNGLVQVSVGNLRTRQFVSKAVIIGIAFGSIVALCTIAVVFFYCRRRRKPLRHLESPQQCPMDSCDPRSAPWDVHTTKDPIFISPEPVNPKHALHLSQLPSCPQTVSSRISSGFTRSDTGYIDVYLAESQDISDLSEVSGWALRPPEYTLRPLYDHHTTQTTPSIEEDSVS
ncbi:hypothetical protein FRC17_001265 [Serendipita sp. 399]|nr:hypothetical protein FRC17_001265 [Serendipita sp. 399]